MRLRVRLQRLERHAATNEPPCPPQDVFERIRRAAAYYAGRTPRPPDPPCPPGRDPGDWAIHQRVRHCLAFHRVGTLNPDRYLPDMTAEERTYVDNVAGVPTDSARKSGCSPGAKIEEDGRHETLPAAATPGTASR